MKMVSELSKDGFEGCEWAELGGRESEVVGGGPDGAVASVPADGSLGVPWRGWVEGALRGRFWSFCVKQGDLGASEE